MNFITLQKRRINLHRIIAYWASEQYHTILNKQELWCSIFLEGTNGKAIELIYQTEKARRDEDLKILDKRTGQA